MNKRDYKYVLFVLFTWTMLGFFLTGSFWFFGLLVVGLLTPNIGGFLHD